MIEILAQTSEHSQATMMWVSIIGAIASAIAGVLAVWYSKGGPARVAEIKARAALEASNTREVVISYETMMGDMKAEHQKDMTDLKLIYDQSLASIREYATTAVAKMEATVEIVSRKLDECEAKHEQVMREAAFLKGKLEGLQALSELACRKVDDLSNRAVSLVLSPPKKETPDGLPNAGPTPEE